MEQHRTRPPQSRPRRGPAALPPQAQGGRGDERDAAALPAESATVYRAGGAGRPVPPLVRALRRFPNPRLTGLGSGLFCLVAMVVLGFLDRVLLGGAVAVYGVLFLLVSGLAAGWVRKADLVTAPVSVPIAFALGALFIADGGEGFTGTMAGLMTTLATGAGWLYGGTLVAGVIVTVRKVRLMARKAAARRATQPGPRDETRKAPRPRRA
ncbi:hypothetical protein GTY65_12450 [Streptomyces sp. SID8379]|uniref:DUF6542 domain-containing protein n=1 Tax=unclassified Streptomyces TaxID=2593676 RepID=UPI000373A4CA|nr:DUF6542 domain-containing protein [Streptomyces sp. HmicA12]MYW64871.1 hypothetical protein [Streptomyces sp. SID8379]